MDLVFIIVVIPAPPAERPAFIWKEPPFGRWAGIQHSSKEELDHRFRGGDEKIARRR
jgi:hypothetical protein